MAVKRVGVRASALFMGFVAAVAAEFASAEPVSLHVVSEDARVSTRPSDKSDVIAAVPVETVLEVIGIERGWFWVLLPRDGNGTRRAGWIDSDKVRVMGDEPSLQFAQPAPEHSRRYERRLKQARQNLDKAKRDYEKLTGTADSAAEDSTSVAVADTTGDRTDR